MDLDEPADVYWPQDLSPNVVRGAQKKSCETIAEAVRFVMETLPEPSERAPTSPRISISTSRKFGRSTRAPNTRLSRLSLTQSKFDCSDAASRDEAWP